MEDAPAQAVLGGLVPGEDGKYLAHPTVIVGEPLVELGKGAPDIRASVAEIDLKSRLSHIEGAFYAPDPGADN